MIRLTAENYKPVTKGGKRICPEMSWVSGLGEFLVIGF